MVRKATSESLAQHKIENHFKLYITTSRRGKNRERSSIPSYQFTDHAGARRPRRLGRMVCQCATGMHTAAVSIGRNLFYCDIRFGIPSCAGAQHLT
jgi:hypothetical protein